MTTLLPLYGVYFISIHHPLHAGLGHFYYPAHIVFVVLVREDGIVTSRTRVETLCNIAQQIVMINQNLPPEIG